MSRKNFIAGNWKMNTTLEDAVELAKQIVASVGSVTDVDIAVCPPYVNLFAVGEIVRDSNIKLGAQDVHWKEKGAYTGKISCDMLKSVGVECVIIGHSEQRTFFNETNKNVNKKIKASLAAGLIPIVCIGETIDERKSGKMETVVETQTRGAFVEISKEDALKCIIAYEPVWAIGTGETATPQQANEAHIFVRKIISDIFDTEAAENIRIQYGGSMKPDNAKELLEQTDVDGGLIGGASLKAVMFEEIIRAA